MQEQKLKRLSLAISIIGIFVLFIILSSFKPVEISNPSQLKQSEFVKTTGKAVSIKDYNGFYLIKLNNNITITCNSCNPDKNKTLEVYGRVINFENKFEISAEMIKYA